MAAGAPIVLGMAAGAPCLSLAPFLQIFLKGRDEGTKGREMNRVEMHDVNDTKNK